MWVGLFPVLSVFSAAAVSAPYNNPNFFPYKKLGLSVFAVIYSIKADLWNKLMLNLLYYSIREKARFLLDARNNSTSARLHRYN